LACHLLLLLLATKASDPTVVLTHPASPLSGKTLKKKQTFTLISQDGAVHIRTHLDKFMYGDKDGKIHGDAESPSKETEWNILPQSDGTWALKTAHGFFFHGTGDKLSAFVGGDEPPSDGRWVVHLAMHPQINLYNVMRKRFVHLESDELRCTEDIPWGEDALLTLEFFDEHPEGRYGIMSCNGRYLESSGRLQASPTPSCQFLLGFHDDQISLCNDQGSE
jgi:fascin 1/2